MKQVLKALDSINTLWGISVAVATVAVSVYVARNGTQGSTVVAVISGVLFWVGATLASWLTLRLIVLVLLVLLSPSQLADHLPALIAGTLPTSLAGTSPLVGGTVSARGAAFLHRRLVARGLSGLEKEVRRLAAPVAPNQDLADSVRRRAARWTIPVPAGPRPERPRALTDPIHTSITLGEDFDWLLRHPLVQRMNEVRQLAFAFPSFPGGTHTRLAHSLGVAHLAGMTTRRVLERGSVYSRNGDAPHRLSVEEQRRLINLATAAGLVHDVGHTPLGHSLDRFFGRKHKVGNAIADKKFLPELIARLKEPLEAVEGVRVQDVVTVLSKGAHELHGWHQFISSLLDSDLDVDRLDYLQRDAHFTGQQEGLLSFEKIIDAVRPFDLDERIYLAFDEEAINDIDQFVYARDAMYLRCYEYRTKIVSEWLTQHAINELFQQHAGLDGVINEFALLSDGQLLDLIMESGQVHVIETISRVFRSEACAYAEVFAVGFRKRHLRARLATLQEDFTVSEETLLDKVAGLETEVAATAGISRDDIVITLPDLRLAADEREPGLDIWIMTRRAGGGHEIVPMLDEEDEASPSDLLRRRKYVPLERVLSADDLQQLKQQARAEGFSLLRLLRDARYKIHVFLHRRSMDKKDAVVDAFRACGVIADA